MFCDFIKDDDTNKPFQCKMCGYRSRVDARRQCPKLESKEGIESPRIDSPSTFKKIGNFGRHLLEHASDGFQRASEEDIQDRLEVCKGCELFKLIQENPIHGVCQHESCGCSIKDTQVFLNKLAWKSSECPLKKWKKID